MPLWSYPWQRVKDPLMIPSGALRQSIRIQEPSELRDSFGGPKNAWTTILTCFAAIETVSMKEQFQEGFVSQVVHKISIRWPGESVPIVANMRVLVDPQMAGALPSLYQIQTVENVQQRNKVMHLICLETNGDQVNA